MSHVLDEAIDRIESILRADLYYRTRANSDDVERVQQRAARGRDVIRSLIAALRVLRRERDAEPGGYCDCCGLALYESPVWDGQPLSCGCAGHWSVDRESAEPTLHDGGECPPWARCREEEAAP